jgi:hypothetical protein
MLTRAQRRRPLTQLAPILNRCHTLTSEQGVSLRPRVERINTAHTPTGRRISIKAGGIHRLTDRQIHPVRVEILHHRIGVTDLALVKPVHLTITAAGHPSRSPRLTSHTLHTRANRRYGHRR